MSFFLLIECDCNGYNSECNHSTGVCECLSFGVTGNHCEQCDAVSDGNADNFCFCELHEPTLHNQIYKFHVSIKAMSCNKPDLTDVLISFLYVAEMQVNFIYTYSVDMDREQEGFFIVTPPDVSCLAFNSLKYSGTSHNRLPHLRKPH